MAITNTVTILAAHLTTTPVYTGQPHTLCPVTQRVVFVPPETFDREWRQCEACGACHRVVFIGGNKRKPALKCL